MDADQAELAEIDENLTQLAQFWIGRGSQFVAAGLTDQDVKWLRGADLGM